MKIDHCSASLIPSARPDGLHNHRPLSARSQPLQVSNLSHPVSLKDILILSSTTPNLTSVFRPWSCLCSRDSHVVWSLSLRWNLVNIYTAPHRSRHVVRSLLSAPNQTYVICTALKNIKWSKELSSTQTIVNLQQSDCSISCYKRLPLFMTCLCFHHNFLTQPTMFVYYAFLFSKTFLTQPLLYYVIIAYFFLSFLCLVPSLCLYIKLPIIYWHWKGTI